MALYAALIVPCAGSPSGANHGPVYYDWGPIASRIEGVNGVVRKQILGPFYEHSHAPNGDEVEAYRPLFSRSFDASTGKVQREYAWPIASGKTLGSHSWWRFLLTFYYDWDRADPTSRSRLMVFPFYYQGRDSAGRQFRAFWPFGGTIREMFSNDKISFVMWPIRIRTEVNETRTSHWMWPIYARGSGDDMERFRVLPFYGKHTRDKVERKTVAWPFYTSVQCKSPAGQGAGHILWPLWGRFSYPSEQTWMFLPPFFRVTKSEQQTKYHLPFPFVQVGTGNVRKFYVWPLWGTKSMPGNRSWFCLWPLIDGQRIDKVEGVQHRFRVMPFVWMEKRIARVEDGMEPEHLSSYFKLWPLFSWRESGDRGIFRMLELWPAKNAGPVERNLAPFWTVYRRNWIADASESECLWGLYRRRSGPDGSRYLSFFPLFNYHRSGQPEDSGSFSIMKGFLGMERQGDTRQWQLLYFLRFGGKGEQP